MMSKTKDGIINFSIKLARKDDADGVIETLYMSVRVLTTLETLEILDFNKGDLMNIGTAEVGILNLNIHVAAKAENNSNAHKELRFLSKMFTINATDIDFRFDKDIYSVFVGNLIIPASAGPTGTKRTVITYEDTDVIDDTEKA